MQDLSFGERMVESGSAQVGACAYVIRGVHQHVNRHGEREQHMLQAHHLLEGIFHVREDNQEVKVAVLREVTTCIGAEENDLLWMSGFVQQPRSFLDDV